MASYLAQEVQLARRHDEILSQRSVLLQQMETHLGDKKTEKTLQLLAADAAYKRNAALLNFSSNVQRPECENAQSIFTLQDRFTDMEAAEKRLQAGVHLQPHPDIVKIETLYWASVEESIPKWEQFLLGRAQTPVGFKKKKSSEYNISHAKVAAQR